MATTHKGDFDNMNKHIGALACFCFSAIVAAGCGDGSRTTILNEIIYELPPENPTQPMPPPTNPPAPIDSEAAVMRLDYKVSQAEASISTYLAQLRFVALKDEVGFRRLRVSASKVLPTMTIFVYNPQTFVQQSATFAGASDGFGGSIFEFESNTQFFFGLTEQVGDLLYISLTANTSSLDDETVSFMVEEMDVTTDDGVTSTSTNGLPIVFDVNFDQYPMLASTAVISSREALRSSKTTLGEVDFENIGLYSGDITAVSLQIPTDGLKDVVSLEVQIGNGTVILPPAQNGNMLSGTTVLIDLSPLSQSIAPGASKTIKVVGDTLTGAVNLSCVIRGVSVQRTGNPGLSTFAFGPLDWNESDGLLRLRTTLVPADTTTSVIQGVLPVYSGPSNVTMMRILVTNNGTATKTLRGVYGRVISNRASFTASNLWVQNDSAVILDSQDLQPSRPYRLDTQTSLTLAPGASVLVEIHLVVPSNEATGTTVQFILDAISTDAGLLIVPSPTGNGTSILLG